MARENEMQEFTRSFFRGCPDLSTLTHSIVRRRFLAHVGRDHLNLEEKQALKRLVEEELLKMQVDDAGTRDEKLDFTKKVKRTSTLSSDRERKRFRFNSESESSSAASSPHCFGLPAKNGMTSEEDSPADEEESPRQASKKTVESSDEEQQKDLTIKTGSGESSEEEGSIRTNKVWKELSSEEEAEKEKKKYKGRDRKEPVTKNKQAPGRASVSRKQTREENEDQEGESAQKTAAKKVERDKGTKSHQQSQKEGEEEEILAKNKTEKEQEWKPRGKSSGGKGSGWEERSCQQKRRAGKLTGDREDSGEEKEEEAVGSGHNSGGDEVPPVQRKSTGSTQWKGGKRHSGSSEEEEDSWKAKGTRKTTKLSSINGEESDLEREVGSNRRGEDHPAVMRLKRYIRACGAHRNYKKLLGSCRSHKERLSVLRAELEALGMKGNPSLEKCRALKEQREEAAEVASLDVANIISSSGRPRRRTAWNPSEAPPGELYRRTLDSEEEQPRPAPPDWSHMRGIISSDGESN
ncbi:HIRA-interacting protein 3 [Tupaia chinensis]|uniref:HIRA-interacting protein 3 n=1 Tax=Tupaia chinensis TaxID=246437 RepID=L9KV69_TUPCH|nr:HIRA-interacting protein 3 [Tupaia chinensis]